MKEEKKVAISKDGGGEVELKRNIGLIGGISLVVGSMIGSGIFMSPKSILLYTESVGASLCVWGGCGVLITLCALSYVELGLMIPKSGAEYHYLKETYGDVMAFLLAWTFILISKPSEFAIIAFSFAEYILAPFYPGCSPPDSTMRLSAAVCILIIAFVNGWSVRASNAVQVFFTVAKLLLIAAIIIGGCVEISQGNTQYLENAFEGTTTSVSAIALAFYAGLWSYEGWNFPITIIIGVPLVTVCYVLVNVAYFTVMSPAEVIASNAVAITFGDRVFGAWSWTVPVCVVCSTFGAANGLAFSSARLTYAAGQGGHMIEVLSYINVRQLTPLPAVAFNALIAIIMILPDSSNFETLVSYFTFATWIFYGSAFLAVVILRYKRPDLPRPFKVWIWIPALCFLASLYLIVAPIIESPSLAYLYATIVIFCGLLFYFPFVYFKKVPPFMGWFTSYTQQVLEIVPVSNPPKED